MKQKILIFLFVLSQCLAMYGQNASYKVGDVIKTYTADCEGMEFVVLSTTNDVLTARCTKITKAGEVTVPYNIKDYYNSDFTVEQCLFGETSDLCTKITLSEGIKTVTFNNLPKLQEINLPASITSIGTTSKFPYVAKITIAEGNTTYKTNDKGTLVYEIGTGVANVILTKEMVNGSPQNLTVLDVPEGVKSFRSAYMNSELLTLNLPTTFEDQSTISEKYGNTAWETINVASGNTTLCSVDGILYTKDMSTLLCVPNAKVLSETFTIPDAVRKIEKHAFSFCQGITYIGFNNVNAICKEAFAYSSLKKVELETITDLGESVFYRCFSLEYAKIYGLETIPNYCFNLCWSLKEVVIGPSVKTIGEGAFLWTTSLKSIELHVNKIESYAFRRSGLESVTLGDEVKEIGTQAFDCCNFNTITLGKNVTTLGDNIFSNCISLSSINVEEGNPRYSSFDGILYTATQDSLLICPAGRLDDVVVSDLTKVIAAESFAGCQYIKKVSLGENTQEIGNNAFNKCPSLKEVVVSEKLETIGGQAFSNCSALTTINLGGVKEIGLSCFEYCENLSSVDLSNAKTIKQRAFFNCTALKAVELGSELTSIEAYVFSYTALESVKIPDNVTSVNREAFASCESLTEITFGSGLKTIGQTAFAKCTSIKKVEIPANVEVLSYGAFSGCSLLSEVSFADEAQLKEIGEKCFNNTQIESLIIPNSVETLRLDICPSLKYVTFQEGSKLKYIKDAFKSSQVKVLDFGKADINTKFLYFSCRDMKYLETIKLPCSLREISADFLSGCPNLTRIEFYEHDFDVTIAAYAFRYLNIESIKLPLHTNAIYNGVFTGCSKLKTVDISQYTETIGSQAFLFCTSLTDINVHEDNPWYATSGGVLCDKSKKKMLHFPEGRARENFTLLSPSFEEIGDSAFYYCQNLKNICFPKKLKKIGNYAFHQCKSLNKIYFLTDEPVTEIGDKAFGYALAADIKDQAAFLKENVEIAIRKNGKESMFDTNEYWKNCSKTFSFTDDEGVNEYFNFIDGGVLLLSSKSKNYSTIIPATISQGGTEYKVSVGDYAFEDIDPGVKEIIFEGPVDYMGACAFKDYETQKTNIENVIFTDYQNLGSHELSTNRFKLSDSVYRTVSDAQHIYVAKSLEEDYKNDWNSLSAQISYKIPGIKINTSYGTFSREFDVDLCDEVDGTAINWVEEENRPEIIAYTGFVKFYKEDGEMTYVVMRSINCDVESKVSTKDGDGTYIPKNTGVLLRACTSNNKTPEGFYYRIGEKKYEFTAPVENVMMTVTETGTTIQPTEGEYTNFIFSGGKYYSLGAETTIPVHKSYMHVKLAEGTSAVKLLFSEDEESTGISDVTTNINDDVIYNLQGQRVNGSAKGIVIKNGKAIYVK